MTYREQLRAEQARVRTEPRVGLSNEEYRQLKSALKRAKNSNDPSKVLATVEKAVERFNATIWPDDWAMWRIALEDASSFARWKEHDDELADELYAASVLLFRY